MPKTIRRAVVLGAGLMGSQIAAHLANAGIPVTLLDIIPKLTPEEEARGLTTDQPQVRNRLATEALKKLPKIKPNPLMSPDNVKLITPGNFEDHLAAAVSKADWVLEAVVENLDIKKQLWARVGQSARPGTILSSNTSGLSIAAQAEALPPEHRRNFLGTHFFNPPRYLKLLEIIPIPDTDPAVLEFMKDFGERVLGKGVVLAKDTPNFIANRIGTYGLAVTLKVMAEQGLGVDEVDAITGPAMGRPKSATFRTLDLVGLDTFLHVARNAAASASDPAEAQMLQLPPALEEMVKRGWLGEKSKQGFFKKEKGEILALDLTTLEYRPRRKANFPVLEQTKQIKDRGQRIRALVNADDPAGRFAWAVLKQVLVFCADKADEIAGRDVVAIDQAMRWGFGWDMGPFETWDAIGLQESIARMEAEGLQVPGWVKERAAAGGFYAAGRPAEMPLSFTILKSEPTWVVRKTSGTTFIDLGDEVLGMQFHPPKQAIGEDFPAAVKWAAAEVEKNWRGLVISAEGTPNFCVGANLMLVLMNAQEYAFEDIDLAVRVFQQANMTLKYMARPVVVAPYGMTLGGGAEIAFHADRTVAAAETYMGLVEVGVGLIPAGGGTKEMAVRAMTGLPRVQSQLPGPLEPQALINRAFENIATAKVATSAQEAMLYGYLRPTDQIVMNRDHLLAQAKRAVLELDAAGYQPPAPVEVPVLGPDGRAILEMAAWTLQQGGYASEHDVKIARKIAYILTGGNLPAGTLVSEQYLLDLEREAFVSLCGERKSQERMMAILKTGKPLRN